MNTLVIGSKNYSSWSLRPWLFLRKVAFDFREHLIGFDAPDFKAQIAAVSPSQRVPLLISGDLKIWDSLAICEYAADLTGRGLPADRGARAIARSVSAEMHSSFQTLRDMCPMNVRGRERRVDATPQLSADISRIDAIWSECRQRHAADGDWLFGEFSIADAMYAPVVFRFQTYGAALQPDAQAYVAHVLRDPLMQEWQHACDRESHRLPEVESIGIPQAAES